ncbi:Predicted transcriptional regulator [Klebsiella pneumoniae]|nr:Predicted transcriptional regulator [Klebsiella pneumoniae]STS59502.1 Predicted transcriptional regulator [Klebsiella pneumoniae]SUY86553.1 Predicted transcriptional regulator [Klebsiella pneumoniae]
MLVAYHWKHDLERLLKAFPRGRPVFIHHIIAAGTMDEMVMERRNSKRTVQDILLDAMKKKRPVGRRRWLVASIEMITEKEVMQMMRISSRMTIWKYTERYNFPKPIRTHPKQYLLSEVEAWILNGGINPKSS